MRKIVFFDIDGTLVTEDSKQILPDSTVYAIQALRRNGHLAFINSGRTLFNVVEQPYILHIGFDGYVCACGAHIMYRGQHLLTKTVPEEQRKAIVESARKNNMELMLEGPQMLFFDSSQPLTGKRRQMYEHYPSHRGDAACPNIIFNKFVTWQNASSRLESFLDDVAEWFDYIDRGNGFGEFCPKGYSKATGIQFLADNFNLRLDDCLAIGDSANDLPMLDYVRHSILMGNGTPALRSHVEYVTTDILDDGILIALEHYGLV